MSSQGMPNPTPLSHEAVMHDSQPVLNAFSPSTNKMSSKPHTEEPANDGQSLVCAPVDGEEEGDARAGLTEPHDWTNEQLAYFRHLLDIGTSWHRAQVKGWKPAWTEPFWTDTRTAYLTEVVSRSKTWDEVLARFAEKFQANKSAPATRSRVKKLGLNIDHLRTHQLFTKAEKDYFDELAESGFKGKKMYERFWERFGKRITGVSLARRLSARMKKKKEADPSLRVSNSRWTPEEASFVQECLDSGMRQAEIIPHFRRKFGDGRSDWSICAARGRLVKAEDAAEE
ncbi:uncharacterized protein G6M90_00g058960 [Metarhizium brunneum]|uniref:Uncharacterized protein n=1 Tax=Metarhizium brunneum TaxID=500148 RepID=A0A7D5YTR5_9HYPO|nr:hypothetical protein G6M90_00g058960 [Metarhizium brunneum]